TLYKNKEKKSLIITISIVILLVLSIILVIYLNSINFFDEKSDYYVTTPNTTYTLSINDSIIKKSSEKIKEYDHYIVDDSMGVIYTKDKKILKYMLLAKSVNSNFNDVYRIYTVDNKTGEILVLENHISSSYGEEYILEINARNIMS